MRTNPWPYVSEKEVIVGNLDASVGICTRWSPRKEFVEKYLRERMDKIAIVGNLYSVSGIGRMMRNFLANTNLRYLIVSGSEAGKASDILNTMRGELTEDTLRKIQLEREQVDRFFSQVRVIHCAPGDLGRLLDSGEYRSTAHELGRFAPIGIPIPKPVVQVFPTAGSGHLIRARTIAEGYVKLLREIRNFGHVTGDDSEGHRRQELWQLKMIISDQQPESFDTIPHPEYEVGRIKKYCEDFWNGTEPQDLAYRYGHIIRFSFGDQVQEAIEAFKKKAETFRVVISLWDPRVEGGSLTAEDPPCITVMQLRLTGGKLYLWGYIRTNDMFGGWPINAIALRYFQWRFLHQLRLALGDPSIEMGELEVDSGSAHFYERDWAAIDTTISESKKIPLLFDPKGNFEVKMEDGEIVVNHYSPDGEFLQDFRGTDAEQLRERVSLFISDVGNALYVGGAIQREEMRLKNA